MRTQTVFADDESEAQEIMPWAARIEEVDSGHDDTRAFMGFESITDWEIWKNQR